MLRETEKFSISFVVVLVASDLGIFASKFFFLYFFGRMGLNLERIFFGGQCFSGKKKIMRKKKRAKNFCCKKSKNACVIIIIKK